MLLVFFVCQSALLQNRDAGASAHVNGERERRSSASSASGREREREKKNAVLSRLRPSVGVVGVAPQKKMAAGVQ